MDTSKLTVEQKEMVLRARELNIPSILIEAALLDNCLSLLIADAGEPVEARK